MVDIDHAYLSEFIVESQEVLDWIEQDLVALEQSPENREVVHKVFRAIHTIKGNCGFLGFRTLEGLTHRGETVLDRIRNGHAKFDSEVASVLLAVVDASRELLDVIENDKAEGTKDYSPLLQRLNALIGK